MSPVSKRAALGVLTLAGLVLAVAGLWFLGHLGLSGRGSFSATPSNSRIVVLDPSVLNRVDSPVTITAKAKDGGDVWIGRSAPSDARSLVGKAAATSVTGVSVGSWQLETASRGTGTAPALAGADLWRQQVAGKGTATLTVSQDHAPETVVVASPSGKPADLSGLTLTWQRQAWSAEAITALVLGLVLAAGGALGLVRMRKGSPPVKPDIADEDSPFPTPRNPRREQQAEEPTVALPAQEPTVALPAEEPTVALPAEESTGALPVVQPATTTSEEGRR